MSTLTLQRRPRPVRVAAPRGWLVALSLASGLAVAVGLQLAGTQVQARFAAWFGMAPSDHVAGACPVTGMKSAPAAHPSRNHIVALAGGNDVISPT
jgi:hypothetical protein